MPCPQKTARDGAPKPRSPTDLLGHRRDDCLLPRRRTQVADHERARSGLDQYHGRDQDFVSGERPPYSGVPITSDPDVVVPRTIETSSEVTDDEYRLANEGPMFMFKGWLPAWTRLQPTTILM